MADPNRQMFEWVVKLLRPLLGELVFVGGCTTGLLITDPIASGIRPTNDVDAIVDVTTYARYAALSEQIARAASEARMFIASQFSTLMANMEFREALSGFLLPDAASQARRRLLEERLGSIAALA